MAKKRYFKIKYKDMLSETIYHQDAAEFILAHYSHLLYNKLSKSFTVSIDNTMIVHDKNIDWIKIINRPSRCELTLVEVEKDSNISAMSLNRVLSWFHSIGQED